MFGKSIVNKIVKDFDFVKEKGFLYVQSKDDQFDVCVLFKSNRYYLEIGYGDYKIYNNKLYVFLYDIFKIKDERNHIKSSDSMLNWHDYKSVDILEGNDIKGKNYKQQVDQVKDIVLKKLKELKENKDNSL